MSTDFKSLPQGIRNNNPGNLRTRMGDKGVIGVNNKFGQYASMLDGVTALAELLHVYYNVHEVHTINGFVQRYAPAMENNVIAYEDWLCTWLRIGQKDAKTKDISLNNAWRAIDMIRGIVSMENGWPPPDYAVGGEWIGPETYIGALRLLGNWGKF